MVSININGRIEQGIVKPIDANRLKLAEAVLKDPKNADGFDSLGVKQENGDAVLVLLETHEKLSKTDKVSLDGKPVTVQFAENEINTAPEHLKKTFSTTGPSKVIFGAGVGAATSVAAGTAGAFILAPIAIGLALISGGNANLFKGITGTPAQIMTGIIAGGAALGAAGTAGLLAASDIAKGVLSKPDHQITDRLTEGSKPEVKTQPAPSEAGRVKEETPDRKFVEPFKHNSPLDNLLGPRPMF